MNPMYWQINLNTNNFEDETPSKPRTLCDRHGTETGYQLVQLVL